MIEMPFNSPADFTAGVAPASAGAPAVWFVFKADRLLVELGPPSPHPSGDLRVPARPSWAKLPLQKNNNPLWFEPVRTLYLGRLAGADCWAAEAPAEAAAPPPGLAWEGLRTLFSVLEDAHFALAGRAVQLLDWDRSHRYFASQPWPFPNSLMIAFVCDWLSGEIRPQAGEIEAAAWFSVLQLPKLPSKISIARRLIDAVVAEMRARPE